VRAVQAPLFPGRRPALSILAGMPTWFAGLLNPHGQWNAVIDLALLMGHGVRSAADPGRQPSPRVETMGLGILWSSGLGKISAQHGIHLLQVQRLGEEIIHPGA